MGRTWGLTALSVGVLLASACSGSGGSSDATTAVTATSTTTEVDPTAGAVDPTPTSDEVDTTAVPVADASTTTAAATTTTEPPITTVPAGVQYGAPELLPQSSRVSNGGVTRDGVLYLPARYITDQFTFDTGAGLIVRQPDGTSTLEVVDDNGGYVPPPGFPIVKGFGITAMASGVTGIVAVGAGGVLADRVPTDASSQSLIWFSADGASWQRIDPRDVTGPVPLQLSDVSATATGFVAVGTTSDAYDLNGAKTDVVVLTSTDGVNWQMLPKISAQWSIDASEVGVVGDEIVVSGVQYACTKDSANFVTFDTGSQFRLWHTSDDGATWSTITGPDTGLVAEPEPAPTDAVQCPTGTGTAFYEENTDRFESGPAAVVITELGVVIVESGSNRVGVSADLSEWLIAEADNRLPTPLSEDSVPTPSRALSVFQQASDLVIVSAEKIRDENNVQGFDDGDQMYSWRSGDDGRTWEPQPLGRPLLTPPIGQLALIPIGDDAIGLLSLDAGGGGTSNDVLWVSSGGDFIDYTVCLAAPGADCTFATTFAGAGPEGQDLSGIDLRGAQLSGDVDFDGANLTGARFDGATVNARFDGANLTLASLVGADFADADLSGATLTGATFLDASVGESILVAVDVRGALLAGVEIEFAVRAPARSAPFDLSGLDLTGARFASYGDAPRSFAGSSFAGATLIGVGFAGVDLTGVDLTGAVLDGVHYFRTTCPDGAPADEGVDGPAGCRLG